MSVKSICVYCGSSLGTDPEFSEVAGELGSLLADRNYRLVYGGAHRGLMGQLADACLQGGGEVLGIIPRLLNHREITHTGLSELIVTESMHERKTLMEKHSDAFIALPGGFGTLEELMEILTWCQLGLVNKPIGVLNTAHYYDALLKLFNQMKEKGMLTQTSMESFVVSDTPNGLLEEMTKWLAV